MRMIVPRLRGLAFLIVFLSASLFAVDKADVVLNTPAPYTFIAYGDMRVSQPSNRDASNPEARRDLIKQIVSEHPAFVTISGDLVLNGDDDSLWSLWDQEFKPMRDAGIEILPALGNHDVRHDRSHALQNYFARFPQIKGRNWYSAQAGPLYIVALDSISDDTPNSEQGRWVKDQLEHLPADVKYVMIFAHHPMVTHSSEDESGGGHSTRPQEHALGEMIEQIAAKSTAKFMYVAGHVHNYERYQEGPVMAIVSGGGGATPYIVPRQAGDFYTGTGPTYHYCRITVGKDALKFEMVKLDGDASNPKFDVKDAFELRAK